MISPARAKAGNPTMGANHYNQKGPMYPQAIGTTLACAGFLGFGAWLVQPQEPNFSELLGVVMLMVGGYLMGKMFRYVGTLRDGRE